MEETISSNQPEEIPQQTPENHEPQSLKKILFKGFFLGMLLIIVVGLTAIFLLNKVNQQSSVVPKPTPTKPKINNSKASKTYTDNSSSDNQLPMAGSFIWNVPANSLSADLANKIKTSFSTLKLSDNNQNNTTHMSVDEITISSASSNFASARLTVRDNKNTIIPTDGIEYYLQNQNGQWKIITGSDPNFCQDMKTFPSDIMDESSYHDYYGCPK